MDAPFPVFVRDRPGDAGSRQHAGPMFAVAIPAADIPPKFACVKAKITFFDSTVHLGNAAIHADSLWGAPAELIGNFFAENSEGLQQVAEIVREAREVEDSRLRIIRFFTERQGEIKEKGVPGLPLDACLESPLQHLNAAIKQILEPANDKLAPLSASFPQEARRILGYAITERTGDRQESGFYC